MFSSSLICRIFNEEKFFRNHILKQLVNEQKIHSGFLKNIHYLNNCVTVDNHCSTIFPANIGFVGHIFTRSNLIHRVIQHMHNLGKLSHLVELRWGFFSFNNTVDIFAINKQFEFSARAKIIFLKYSCKTQHTTTTLPDNRLYTLY